MFKYARQPNVFVIGDLHLNEMSLIQKARQQFESCEAHNAYLIMRWNKVVKTDEDVVYVIGDIGRDKEKIKEVFSKLRGYKILIAGNHDTMPKEFYEEIFDEVYWHPVYLTDRLLLSHIPRMIEDGNINVHGHTHWINIDDKKHFNVSCEVVDFQPQPLSKYEKVLTRIAREEIHFMREWYKDIQKPVEGKMPTVVVDEKGYIDVRATFALRHNLKIEEEN
jgi:calcineurin-like phosphoesterase family protein